MLEGIVMTLRKKYPGPLAAALFTGLLMAGGAHADNHARETTETIQAQYKIYWKGFKVMTVDALTELSDGHYRQAMEMRVSGMLDLFTDGRTRVVARGGREGDQFVPRFYASRSLWDGDIYARVIQYEDGNAVPAIAMDIPQEWLEREAVPDALQANPDPLSLILLATTDPWGLTGAQGAGETITLGTFDGLRSYDYQLSCEDGFHNYSSGRDVPYEGRALKCSLSGRQTGGFRIREEHEREEEEDEGGRLEDQVITLWLARIEGASLYMPIRIDMESRRGNARILLREINRPLVGERLVKAPRQAAAGTGR